MNNKYGLYIVFSALIVFLTTSCVRRLPIVFYNADDKVLAKRFEQILVAIENRDTDSLKAMFSKKALEESKQIDEAINYLFSSFHGKVLSLEQKGVSSSENRESGKKIKEISCLFYVDTTADQKYIAFVLECTENTAHPENVGLYTLRIIKAEDKETQFGYRQDMKIPGIYHYQPEGSLDTKVNQ